MRIRDWSSDVCSSDLSHPSTDCRPGSGPRAATRPRPGALPAAAPALPATAAATAAVSGRSARTGPCRCMLDHRQPQRAGAAIRSEEHPSELQSLMRIAYAVFFLKQENKQVADDDHTEL